MDTVHTVDVLFSQDGGRRHHKSPPQVATTSRHHKSPPQVATNKSHDDGPRLGGPIGLGLAGRRPELVRRLIIGNTWAWPLLGERRIRIFSWVMGGPIGRALTGAFIFVPRAFFARGFARPLPPEVRAQYLAPWRDPARRAPAVISPRQLIKATDYLEEVEANLPRLADRPALIVWGAKDFAFREPERVRFEATFPNHRTIVFEDASHFLQEDAGDRIVDAYRTFRREIG